MDKKINTTFFDETDIKLPNNSQLKLFNILEQPDGKRYLNIFRSYKLNDEVLSDTVFYDTYEVQEEDWWENISYRIYGSVYSWWTVPLINDVVNPFEELNIGENIKYLKSRYRRSLFTEITEIGGL